MSPKLHKMDCFILKPAHLTTPVLKSGAKDLTILNLISGLLDASSIRWSHLTFLSKPKIWKV